MNAIQAGRIFSHLVERDEEVQRIRQLQDMPEMGYAEKPSPFWWNDEWSRIEDLASLYAGRFGLDVCELLTAYNDYIHSFRIGG